MLYDKLIIYISYHYIDDKLINISHRRHLIAFVFSVLSNPADVQNVSCQELCGSDPTLSCQYQCNR